MGLAFDELLRLITQKREVVVAGPLLCESCVTNAGETDRARGRRLLTVRSASAK